MPSPLPALPPDNTIICVVVPDSQEWIRLYLGTLSMLTRWWYYDVNNESEAEDVVQRAMSCNAETGADYEDCMTLDCNDVLECILQTPEIQQAIAQFAIGSSITATDTENDSILNSNTFPVLGSCTNAQVFGMTTQLVDLIDTISLTILDRFVASLNSAGNLGYLIEGIPVIGELPIDDILTFVQTVAVQINTEYQASADVQLLEDIACDLMCIGMEDCDLTFQEIRDYYQDKIVLPIQYDTMEELVLNIVANGWFGDQAVYIIHFFIVQLVVIGGEITGIDANRIIKTVSSYYNDPNPDWSTICDDCPEQWTSTLDLTSSDYGFTFIDGEWIDTVGFVPTANTGNDNRLYATLAFDEVNITFVSWQASITIPSNPQGDSVAGLSIKDNSVNTFAQPYTYPQLGNGTSNLDFNATINIQGDFIDLFLRPDNNGSSGSGVVSEVVLSGTGTKPSQLP